MNQKLSQNLKFADKKVWGNIAVFVEKDVLSSEAVKYKSECRI